MSACDIAKGIAPKPKSNVNTQFLDNIIKELRALPDCDTLNGAAEKYMGIIQDQLNDTLKQLDFLGPYVALLNVPTNPKKLSKYLKDFVKMVIGTSIIEQIKSYKEQLEAYKNALEEIQNIIKEKAESLESCKISAELGKLDSCVLDEVAKFLTANDVDLSALDDIIDIPGSDTTIDQDIQSAISTAISNLQLNPPAEPISNGNGITGTGTATDPLKINLAVLNQLYASLSTLEEYISLEMFNSEHIQAEDPHDQYVLKTDLNKNFDIVAHFRVYYDSPAGSLGVLQVLDQSPNVFTFTSDTNFHYVTAPFLNSSDYLVMSDIQHLTFNSITDGIVRFIDIQGNSIRIGTATRPAGAGEEGSGGQPAIDARFWVVRKPQN